MAYPKRNLKMGKRIRLSIGRKLFLLLEGAAVLRLPEGTGILTVHIMLSRVGPQGSLYQLIDDHIDIYDPTFRTGIGLLELYDTLITQPALTKI
jgi:hypothetical protein